MSESGSESDREASFLWTLEEVSRLVSQSGDATETLKDGAEVTVSCAEGDTGHVHAGLLEIEIDDIALDKMPPSPTKIMMNVGNPELAFAFQRLPNEGVGLARLEFIINKNVGVHPKAIGEIPYDREVPIAVNRGVPVPMSAPRSSVSKSIADIAESLLPAPAMGKAARRQVESEVQAPLEIGDGRARKRTSIVSKLRKAA